MHRSLISLAFALALVLPSHARDVEFEPFQPVYEIGVPGNFTITGTPGDFPFLLHAFDPGPTTLPFVGSVGVGLTGLKVVPLPVFPPSGSQVFTCYFACDPGLALQFAYAQAVSIRLSPFEVCKSEPVVVEFTDGDCTTVCSGGIEQLGVELELCNPPSMTGHVLIELRNAVNIPFGMALFPNLDLDNLPPLPLTEGAFTLQKLAFNATTGCITVRYCVDATALGLTELPASTTFFTDWSQCDQEATIPTNCEVPIEVGDTFGVYTITKLVDLF